MKVPSVLLLFLFSSACADSDITLYRNTYGNVWHECLDTDNLLHAYSSYLECESNRNYWCMKALSPIKIKLYWFGLNKTHLEIKTLKSVC